MASLESQELEVLAKKLFSKYCHPKGPLQTQYKRFRTANSKLTLSVQPFKYDTTKSDLLPEKNPIEMSFEAEKHLSVMSA